MKQFRNAIFYCLGWLAVSEILCLVLAFSFAILRPEWVRYLSMLCGVTAHVLLMWSCGQKLSKKDAAEYRISGSRISAKKPVILAVCTAIPLWVFYGILWMNADSSAMLNAFLLLNAPYIQFHRLMLGGLEPFSAVPLMRRILMGIPPVVTAISLLIGYIWNYETETAAISSRKIPRK